MALQSALSAGESTLFVCPGTYQGNFTINRAVTVIGAGQETDPATNTILDANQSEHVVVIPNTSGAVTLERLHVTGGSTGRQAGAGIRSDGPHTVLRDCTIAGNEINEGSGAGIGHLGGTLELIRCTVRDNHGVSGALSDFGGGIANVGGLLLTVTDCLVVNNTVDIFAGGIYLRGGSVTLAGRTEVSGNSAGEGGGIYTYEGSLTVGAGCRVTHNHAASGGGIGNLFGTVTLQGAQPDQIVIDNCPNNCTGSVPGCTETQISCP